MYIRKIFLPLAVVFVITFSSCYYDNEETLYPVLNASCDTTAVTYSITIAALMNSNCTSCHSGSTASGSISLTSYSGVKSNITAVVGSIKHTGTYFTMPPGGSLSACSISQLDIWVRNGMPNN
jgi:hypothetical protein